MAEQKNKILIIDDDKFLLDMYSLKFNENGFAVESFSSAEDALGKIDRGYVPDICLVDIIMPGMDGFTFVAEAKKREPMKEASVIILSNLGQKEDIEKGLALGANGYIVKASATPTEVVNKVKEIVGNKKK